MATNASALVLPAQPAGTNASAAVDIRDIRPPLRIPTGWEWLGWTLAGAALAALLYWAWRHWRRRKQAAARPIPAVPPHELARQKLREALAFIDQPKPFCIAVSDALRCYLEQRFNWHAPERTTEEFLEELQASALLSLEQKRSLGEFLLRCDLVKFARYEPLRPELQEIHDVAWRLIQETEPSPLPAGGETAQPPAEATPAVTR